MKKIIAFILIINFLIASSTVFAENVDSNIQEELTTNADACILYDMDFKTILYEKNCHDLKYPASTTKLLATEVIIERCQDLSELVNVSYYAVRSVPYSYSIAPLQPGEILSVKDLLYAMLVGSSNDASYVLAQYVAEGGNNYLIDSSINSKNQFENDIKIFSELMNSKAREIGCIDSNFVNPNGIHSNEHYSTAYDLALIGAYCYKNPIIRNMVTTMEYELPNTEQYNKEARVLKNTNLLLYKERSTYYEYANGLKTGYTDAASNCIIASASKDDRNLIVVVLHANKEEDKYARENDCKKLFEYGFNNYKSVNIVNKGDIIKEYTVLNGNEETRNLQLMCSDTVRVLLKTGDVLDITPEIKIKKKFAPISQGEVVGSITYKINNETFKINLTAVNGVEPLDNFYIIIVILFVFVVLLFVVIVWELYRKRRKKRKRRDPNKLYFE